MLHFCILSLTCSLPGRTPDCPGLFQCTVLSCSRCDVPTQGGGQHCHHLQPGHSDFHLLLRQPNSDKIAHMLLVFFHVNMKQLDRVLSHLQRRYYGIGSSASLGCLHSMFVSWRLQTGKVPRASTLCYQQGRLLSSFKHSVWKEVLHKSSMSLRACSQHALP